MDNFQDINFSAFGGEQSNETQIAVLEFNDEQKAAMGKALMAVAEAIEPKKPELAPLRSGDVIDLLSDGDSDSDCEIMGFLEQDTGELIVDHSRSILPFEMKVDIKQEIMPQIVNATEEEVASGSLPTQTLYKLPATTTITKTIIEATNTLSFAYQREQNVAITSILNENDLEDDEDEPERHTVEEDKLPTVDSKTNVNEEQVVMCQPMIEKIDSLPQPFVSLLPTESPLCSFTSIMEFNNSPEQTNIPHSIVYSTDDTATASEGGNSEPLVNDEQSSSILSMGLYATNTKLQSINADVATTFGVDGFDEDFDEDENTNITTGDTNITMDEDIIEIGSDDDDIDDDNDLDEETEKKVFSLIESDSEEEVEDNQTNKEQSISVVGEETEQPPNTIDMLMHFICPECNEPCGNIKKWKIHTDTMHDFRSIAQLNMRTIINKEGELCNQCKDCQQKFTFQNTYAKLLYHRISHLPYPEYFKCRLCDMRFLSRPKLRQHLKVNHHKICKYYLRQKRPRASRHLQLYCPICDRQQSNHKKWGEHIDQQHGDYIASLEVLKRLSEYVVECTSCDKKLLKRTSKNHWLLHEKYQTFGCKLCDKRFYNRSSCTCHIRRVHLKINVQRLYRCRYCDKVSSSTDTMRSHIRTKHHLKLLKCEVCDKKFSSTPLLLSHMNFENHQKMK